MFDLVRELRVPLTYEDRCPRVYRNTDRHWISFSLLNISPRTFDTCRQCVEAGVNPQAVARAVFDSNSLGRLKLFERCSGMRLTQRARLPR